MERSIMDKIRSIEEGAHSRLRIEENSELLWRKIEATNKVENPAEMKLRKEKEEYRVSNVEERKKRYTDRGSVLVFTEL
jgi:hypothetical protein